LESRHLVGLFLGVVLLCGVFFTLGYVMGHNQYGDPVHAAAAPERAEAPVRSPAKTPAQQVTPPPAPASTDSPEWDFYAKKPDTQLQPAPVAPAPKSATSVAPSPTPAPHAKAEPATAPAPAATGRTITASAKFAAPRLAKGAIVLQVAALRHESDALAMADALQQKNFPSFVVSPNSDPFYRVQVGPYVNDKAADSARAALEHAGFKAITKR
jgi:DedD protein